jgi:hypothetical protein
VYEEAPSTDPSFHSGLRLRAPFARYPLPTAGTSGRALQGDCRWRIPRRRSFGRLRTGLADGKAVVELKAVKALTEGDEAQLLNYLKGTGYRVGLLLNFSAPSLEHKRRVL